MASSKLTIIGFENYLDPASLFDNLTLPAGIDKDLVINAIIQHGGEFEVLYPDPDYLTTAIGLWGRRWYRTFEKWLAALNFKYDPLYNYDRTEEWTTTDSGTGSSTRANSSSSTGSSTDSGSGTSTDTVSAYNSAAFENDRQNQSSSQGSASSDASGTENETINRKDNNTNIRKGRAYGNIGVTTSQQMLQAELDISYWNLYEHIADIFLEEFCIPVY